LDNLAKRFGEKVQRANGGCWLWTGAVNGDGYGSIAFGKRGRTAPATHIALLLDGRPRPSLRHHALHRCDVPSCVNPSHLWWGTHAENMADMRAKGRLDYSGFSKSWARTSEERWHSHCKQGHELIGSAVYVSPKGRRQCAICMKARKKAYRQPRLALDVPQKPKQTDMLEGA